MCWDGSSDGQNNQRARTALRSEDFGGEFVGRHKNQYGWCISCAASSGVLGCVGMEVVMDKITNAPELLSDRRISAVNLWVGIRISMAGAYLVPQAAACWDVLGWK